MRDLLIMLAAIAGLAIGTVMIWFNRGDR